MSLEIGTRVGPYDIIALLGTGGMGEVYRARDVKLGREVALKILPAAFAADTNRLARLEREARTLAALNHPHIAQLYGFDDIGGVRAIVMELVDGDTIADQIARGPLPIGDALEIARQVADALDAAHERGIIHRDLKPANVKRRADGVVKVLDFGLAKEFAVDARSGEGSTVTALSTQIGAVVGTAAYMSPEQARGQPVDKRADIWSFGCLVFELLTGRRAFAGDTVSDTIASVLEREPDWTALPPATPSSVVQLLRRCLEKNVKHRLRDIGDAAYELIASRHVALATTEPRRAAARLSTWIAVGLLSGLLGAAATAVWLWPRREAPRFAATTLTPLTTYPGYESHPSLSPDGNQVAFTWNGEREDNLDIYVKLVGPGTPLRLTSNAAEDTSPAWSPDGRWIAFLRVRAGGKAAVILIPALGGPERELGEIAIPPFIAGPDFGHGLTWSPDSTKLIVTNDPPAAEPAGLFSWSIASGEQQRLTSLPPKDWTDLAPAMSPDGRTLAFVRFVGFGISDIYLLSLDDGLRPIREPTRLTYQNRFITSPAWVADGRDIVFASGSLTGGSQHLYAIDVNAGAGVSTPVRRLESVSVDGGLVSISRSAAGRPRMVVTQTHFDPGIWQIVLPDGDSTAPVQRLPFLYSTRPEYQPQYSPDGNRVTFVSHSSGVSEIWTSDKDGANLVQLTTAAWPETAAPRWSPDGSRIAFHARPNGPGDIFTISSSGGAPKQITDDPADEWGAAWSPDGRSIYFGSNRTGRFEIWRSPAEGGAATQITQNAGVGPTISSDGRLVYYTRGTSLWRMPVTGGEETRVLESLSDWSRMAIADDGVYFSPARPVSAPSAEGFGLYFLSFATGQTRMIARLEKRLFLGLTVSPDRRRLLYSQIDESGTDLILVDGAR